MGRRILIWYECKKVWFDRRFRILWVVLLTAAAVLAWREEARGPERAYTPGEYRAAYEALADKDPTAVMALFDGPGQEAARRRQLFGVALPEDAAAAAGLWADIREECGAVYGRDAMIEKTIQNARKLEGLSLFTGKSDDNLKNARKTGADFAAARSVEVTGFAAERGVRMLLSDRIVDFFVLALVFFAVQRMVMQGCDSELELLVHGSPLGGGPVAGMRAAALVCVAGSIWASFFLVRLAMAAALYGLGDLTRPVQLISSYIKCLSPMRVWQLLALVFFWKWLWYALLAILHLGLTKVLASDILAAGGIGAVWGLGFFCFQAIAENSYLRPLKYFNLYYLLRPDQIWGSYNNIQVGSLLITGRAFAWVSLLVMAAAAGALFWRTKEKLVGKRRRTVRKRRRRKEPFRGLLSAEFHKCYRVLHVGLILLLVLLVQWEMSRCDAIELGQSERFYRSFLNQWEREIDGRDPELEAAMAAEEAHWMAEFDNPQSAYEPDQIRMVLQTLWDVRDRYTGAVRTAASRGEPVYLFFEGEYARLLRESDRDVKHAGALILLLVLVTAWYVGAEHRSGARVMIRATGVGESRYWRDKLLVLASVSGLLVLLIYGPDVLLVFRTYPAAHALEPVASLPDLAAFPLPVSIVGYLCLLYGFRWLVFLLLAAAAMALTEAARNTSLAALSGVLLMGLPYLLYLMRFSWTRNWADFLRIGLPF